MSDVANILHISRCSFYRNDSSEGPSTRRGRPNSSFTMRDDGDTAVVVDNGIIVNAHRKVSKMFQLEVPLAVACLNALSNPLLFVIMVIRRRSFHLCTPNCLNGELAHHNHFQLVHETIGTANARIQKH